MFARLSEGEQYNCLARTFRLIIRLGDNFNVTLPPPYLEVVSLSPDPLKCGGFADIYRGQWSRQLVAVKKLRTFLIPNESYRLEAYRVCQYQANLNSSLMDAYADSTPGGYYMEIPPTSPHPVISWFFERSLSE